MTGITPEEEAAILADIAVLEGKNSIVEENNETNPVTTEEAIDSNVDTIEDEDEPQEETLDEEIETEPLNKTEAEIRKEVEKELRKKYLSQVNKKDKEAKQLKEELESLKNSWYDEDSIEAVRKIVKAENAQFEASRLEKIEKSNFLKKFSPDSKELSKIEEIKDDFPTMSWEAARRFYLANEKPESLIKPKSSNLSLQWDVAKDVINPSPSEADLMAQIIKEANFYAWKVDRI